MRSSYGKKTVPSKTPYSGTSIRQFLNKLICSNQLEMSVTLTLKNVGYFSPM